MKRINEEKLLQYLQIETWDVVKKHEDPETCTQNCIITLQKYIEQTTTKITIKIKYKKLKPWISQGFINSIKTRTN